MMSSVLNNYGYDVREQNVSVLKSNDFAQLDCQSRRKTHYCTYGV
jgi:hypothetical protein